MAPVGRPRVLDDLKKREICALTSAGCSIDFAARHVGCSGKTIRREIESDLAFESRFRSAQLSAQLAPLRAIRGKAATHWRAAAWLLERVDPEQFAKFDQKLYRPEEVAQLLENIHRALDDQLADIPSKVIATGILQKALDDAKLPITQRNQPKTKLSNLKISFPDPVADFLAEMAPP